MTRQHVLAAVATTAATSAAAFGAAAFAQGDQPTTVRVASATQLAAGATSPVDAPGVSSIRRGKPIPAGYVLVGRQATVTGGRQAAWGAVRVTCPDGKSLRTLAGAGAVGPQPLDSGYPGDRSTRVLLDHEAAAGETASGTVYGVCR